MGIVDVGGKEFDVAPAGLVAQGGNQRGHYIGVVAQGGERAGLDDDGQLVSHGAFPGICSTRRVLPRS